MHNKQAVAAANAVNGETILAILKVAEMFIKVAIEVMAKQGKGKEKEVA